MIQTTDQFNEAILRAAQEIFSKYDTKVLFVIGRSEDGEMNLIPAGHETQEQIMSDLEWVLESVKEKTP